MESAGARKAPSQTVVRRRLEAVAMGAVRGAARRDGARGAGRHGWEWGGEWGGAAGSCMST